MYHFLTIETRATSATEFENLKQGSMSVWDYHMRFADLSKDASYMMPTMEARVRRYVQGLSHFVINEAATVAVNFVMNNGKMVAFSQTIETRKLKNIMEREGNKKSRSTGNFGGSSNGGSGGRIVRFEFPNEPVIEWKRDDVVPKGRFISYLTAIKMINKRCIYHLVRVTNIDAEAPTLESVLVVNEFLEVFLDELHGIPLDREIDFGIHVFQGMQPISISPYRMALAELKELNEQLRDFLAKGFI
ncbi:uncharacterized protein [Nicotiana tomentosiformis]|uniref:uncharacterized protein n=1 Tax=Nicotiana tomentosiformis TaxID=4098 RepID=UPI00388CA497